MLKRDIYTMVNRRAVFKGLPAALSLAAACQATAQTPAATTEKSSNDGWRISDYTYKEYNPDGSKWMSIHGPMVGKHGSKYKGKISVTAQPDKIRARRAA